MSAENDISPLEYPTEESIAQLQALAIKQQNERAGRPDLNAGEAEVAQIRPDDDRGGERSNEPVELIVPGGTQSPSVVQQPVAPQQPSVDVGALQHKIDTMGGMLARFQADMTAKDKMIERLLAVAESRSAQPATVAEAPRKPNKIDSSAITDDEVYAAFSAKDIDTHGLEVCRFHLAAKRANEGEVGTLNSEITKLRAETREARFYADAEAACPGAERVNKYDREWDEYLDREVDEYGLTLRERMKNASGKALGMAIKKYLATKTAAQPGSGGIRTVPIEQQVVGRTSVSGGGPVSRAGDSGESRFMSTRSQVLATLNAISEGRYPYDQTKTQKVLDDIADWDARRLIDESR